ncbi:protein of unknown function [Methanoculleus bourgensis]|uniref:Arginine deiminase n=1 Tax=Methanoculleus bourgensis TaxID=83986 RepID=A0A0X3BHN3_9EURY|nr:protein of unknown function [Methanoculleus bourgensis]
MTARVRAEWERLRRVAVHRPGIEMFFGLLEPYAALYERAFSRYEARREHERLEYTLREEFGVRVLRLKETILDAADRDPCCGSRRPSSTPPTATRRCAGGSSTGPMRPSPSGVGGRRWRRPAGAWSRTQTPWTRSTSSPSSS